MEVVALLSFVLTLSFMFFYLLRKPKASPITSTGFKIYLIVGVLPQFLVNRHRFLEWTTQVLSECPTNTSFICRPGKVRGIITANPLNVEHIPKTNFDNYPKGNRFISRLEDFLGHGIFNSDGDLWRVQRKTASYEFNTKSLRVFAMENVTAEIQARLIPALQNKARSNQVLDLQDVLERFAFDNICKLAFNVDPGCLGGDATTDGEFMRAFDQSSNLSSGRFLYAIPIIYQIKKYFKMGSEQRLKKSISTAHKFADNIIKQRLQERLESKDQDLLGRFMGQNNNSPSFLRDIVTSFILAGRDTTSSALSWFFWLLSSHPQVEAKIVQELEAIWTRKGESPSDTYGFEDLREMEYLQAAISESLRLYPPVPVDTKTCLKDDVLPDGTFVGKDWFVTYHTYAMGRMESIWGKDCCDFRPERWLEPTGFCRQESPFQFPVFHAGPRMCLGKDMAFIQMKYIAASIIGRFEMTVQNKDQNPEKMLSLTLRMKGGLPVKVKERENTLLSV